MLVSEPTEAQQPAPETPATALDFRRIYQENANFVWRTMRRLGVQPAHLEDACQEAFLVVHRKLAGFDGKSEKSWLFAIALRVAADHRKRAHIRRERVTGEVPEVVMPPSQHDDLEKSRARDFLQAVLDDLDDDKRAVFVLYELEGMAMPEIADAVGCPVQTAYSRLHAARRRIQDAVAQAKREEQAP